MSEKDVFVIRNGVAVPVHRDKRLGNGNTNSVKWTNNAEKFMVLRKIKNHISREKTARVIRKGK